MEKAPLKIETQRLDIERRTAEAHETRVRQGGGALRMGEANVMATIERGT